MYAIDKAMIVTFQLYVLALIYSLTFWQLPLLFFLLQLMGGVVMILIIVGMINVIISQ